ncbi:tetratricopeptide repeat protein [Bailinhaonella thermotolerans]|uniref:Tetratricopeptide repeat protein n=1 Tax=Bailinhaonella thermotolerans TaxID=1070861 RepID=A0A3A4B4Y5_9ACTN|nr:tetratricopeptide repeat protein [Bailinhaonella thermotolerans]RJL32492.1 tetratricopeptide repeat protein [Bailinhaonella thermotolerans]
MFSVNAGGGEPYTVAAALLGEFVPAALERSPELVEAHDIEIRAAAPALAGLVPARRRSRAADLPAAERILVHGARRTLRVANGLAEFVRDHLTKAGPYRLTVENLDEADHTDREFLTVLRRRVSPELLELTVRDGRGRDPSRAPEPAGLPELLEKIERCRTEGFHHAMARLGERALGLLDHDDDPETWWRLVHRTGTALTAIEREDEARALYDLGRRTSTEPKHRATAAYATAMILVRHSDRARRDPEEAMAWINEAVTITALLPDRRARAFHLGFDLNGKALIELRRGNADRALELVRESIELAERDLDPGEHPIHKLVLRANLAHLLALRGEREAALAELDAVIEADPGYPDYYIDRGNLLHAMGRSAEALRDYETAMAVDLPYPELFYNRAEVRYAGGDLEGALADLDHAVELDPDFTAAYVNRAGLLAALGQYGRARADVARAPEDPYLLCVLGQVEAAEGRPGEAREAYDRAIAADPRLADAWAGRGVLAFENGDAESALADLTRAVELGESAELLFNRSVALRALGRTAEARADLARAAELAPGDEDIAAALAETG